MIISISRATVSFCLVSGRQSANLMSTSNISDCYFSSLSYISLISMETNHSTSATVVHVLLSTWLSPRQCPLLMRVLFTTTLPGMYSAVTAYSAPNFREAKL